MLCLDTTMLRKFENENKNQNKKNLRLKIYGKIRNGRLKLEQSVIIKKTCSKLLVAVLGGNSYDSVSIPTKMGLLAASN